MRARRIAIVLIVALAVAGGTWLLGWWSVPVIAAIAGGWTRTAWPVALGATLGWVLLLAIDAAGGRFGAVASTTAAVMGIPAFALPMVTLFFVAALAWSAAALAEWMTSAVARERGSAA